MFFSRVAATRLPRLNAHILIVAIDEHVAAAIVANL